jgi:multidrug resistance protein, MATE family
MSGTETIADEVANLAIVDDVAVKQAPALSPVRRVWRMAWPIIGENLLETSMGIVDTMMVAWLGAVAIAGVGTAQQVMFFLISMLAAFAIGSTILVAQAIGAQSTTHASQLARQSLVWAALLSIPLAVVAFTLVEPVLNLFGLEAEATRIGVAYLQVTMATVVVMILLFISAGVLRGANDSRSPMLARAIANVLNVVLTYGLIFGAFGLPELGAVGSAWGTLAARLLALSLLLWILWRGRNGVTIRGWIGWRPNLATARKLLNIGIPAALESVMITAGFMTLTKVVASIGTVTLAAHQVAFNALSLSFVPGFGFGITATTLVGQSIGAQRPNEAATFTRIAMLGAVLWMGAIALFLWFSAGSIMKLYTTDPALIQVGIEGLRTVAFMQPLWALVIVYAGALRGAGNTRFPMRTNTISTWVSVGLAYLFVRLTGGSLIAVWGAFGICAAPLAAVLWWQFRRTIQAATSDATR